MKYKTLEDIQNAKEDISCPGEILLETIEASPLTIKQISVFAKKFGTHEALIIGRIAKHGHIHDSAGWNHEFFYKVELDNSLLC